MAIKQFIPATRIRNASPDDVPAIMTALELLSDEIPVKIDTEERRDALHKIVAECCEQSSWVALDRSGHLVGFLLSKTFTFPLPGWESEGFTLPYGGVLEGYRRQGWFSCLLLQAKALERPLHAEVDHANKSSMAARLVKEAFVKYAILPNKDYFIWKPF